MPDFFRATKHYYLCLQAASPLNKSQIISRRLKLDLRNECDAAIAGIRNWNRPNSAATGQSVTLYERHPYTAEHAGTYVINNISKNRRQIRLRRIWSRTHLIPGLPVPHFLSPWTNDPHKIDTPGQMVPKNLVPVFPDPHIMFPWTKEIF